MVAFTPKGGCPLKLRIVNPKEILHNSSIHPQGWVPIETRAGTAGGQAPSLEVAFTPKGGCPLKLHRETVLAVASGLVAFTPKGGCPLKLDELEDSEARYE